MAVPPDLNDRVSAKQWEYQIVGHMLNSDGMSSTIRDLADMGKRGWELVAVSVQFTTHYFHLKRRIVQETR